ncbi:PREDICTED: uncharacterized protein LOC105366934 [Ceratosolen solmsi marchali]|uniref:Uncharacterized protein LOC105366934 n=1 Tax=Ceratosolen solmsi marchali TaxID=326594 RepID=A0AAJ6YTD4_9HYME|nr:PREDICTED: uncharacterized protein LOC105366934 [Ceratosolen solmsi marchali]
MRERQKTMTAGRMLLASSLLLLSMEQIHASYGQQYLLPVNDYRSSIKQPNWMYSEPKYQQIGYNPWISPYARPEKPVGYYNYPWYPTNPHLRTPVPSVDVMNQPHLDDDFDDLDSLNENVNTNLKDSKFLQLIMKHLKGLIIMKDDNDGMHPKDDLI